MRPVMIPLPADTRPAVQPARSRAAHRCLIAVAIAATLTPCARAADPAPGHSGMAVTVVRASRSCFPDTVRVTGTLVPREEAQVMPDSDGLRITQVLVEEGEMVTAGKVLARLARVEGSGASSVQAPSAGLVASRNARVGDIVSIAAGPLFRIIVDGELELAAEVPATRMAKLAPGQVARVELGGTGALGGRVRATSPEIDAATQTGRARIAIDRSDALRAGLFARAIVEVGESCGVAVPVSALLYGPVGSVVQVVRDNRIETRPVPVGLLSGPQVEIREGINDGDLVVARAGSFLREGDRVVPVVVAMPARSGK